MKPFFSSFLVLVSAMFSSACVSALGETPDLTPVKTSSSGDLLEPAGLRAEAEELLAAEQSFDTVDHARELFLEAAATDISCTDCLLGALRAYSWLVENEADSRLRKALAVEAVGIAQLCVERSKEDPRCRYRLALAVGQQARERPSTASDGLDVMIELLRELISTAPGIDNAGPERVMALVLLRAPGWPAGPGDPEAALEYARAAVRRVPDYPPNQLVLGEALEENELSGEADRAYEKALGLARSRRGREAKQWAEEAEEALARSH